MAVNMGAAGQPSKSMVAFRSLELCDRLKLEIESISSEIGCVKPLCFIFVCSFQGLGVQSCFVGWVLTLL